MKLEGTTLDEKAQSARDQCDNPQQAKSLFLGWLDRNWASLPKEQRAEVLSDCAELKIGRTQSLIHRRLRSQQKRAQNDGRSRAGISARRAASASTREAVLDGVHSLMRSYMVMDSTPLGLATRKLLQEDAARCRANARGQRKRELFQMKVARKLKGDQKVRDVFTEEQLSQLIQESGSQADRS